jgi:hypothetical protein
MYGCEAERFKHRVPLVTRHGDTPYVQQQHANNMDIQPGKLRPLLHRTQSISILNARRAYSYPPWLPSLVLTQKLPLPLNALLKPQWRGCRIPSAS